MENLCRLCGNQHEYMFYVFDNFYEDRHIPWKIANVLRIKIDPNDALPQKICKHCHHRLEDASNFIDFCQYTQYRLEELRDARLNLPPVEQTENIGCGSNYSILSSFQVSNNDNPQNLLLPGNNLATYPYATQGISQNQVNPSSVAVGENTSEIIEKSELTNIENTKDHETQTTNGCMENETTRNNSSGDVIADSNTDDHEFVRRLRENLRQSFFQAPKISKPVRTVKYNARKKLQEKRKRKKLAPHRGDSEYVLGTKSTFPKKEWTCDVCQMKFTQETLYTEHLNVHSGKRPHACVLCSSSFRQRQELNHHIRTIHSQKKYKCPKCDLVAKYQGQLTQHVKNVHTKPYGCDLCTYRAGEKGKISNHIATKHNGELSCVCEICGRSFRTRSALHVHRTSIHFPEPKKCGKCGVVCPCLSKYIHHSFLCGKEKMKYTCEHCGESYVSKHILEDHMNKHLNIKPYKCDVCGKCFYQRNRLNTHKYVHMGAIYQCDICDQAFKRKDNMKNHMKRHLDKPMKSNNTKISAVK